MYRIRLVNNMCFIHDMTMTASPNGSMYHCAPLQLCLFELSCILVLHIGTMLLITVRDYFFSSGRTAFSDFTSRKLH